MPTDSALLVAGAGPAPLDYEVPNAQEIIVLSARAVVDGSGAGAAFLPVVEFISDGDIILTQAITDATVAAGASAQVSWFPRVGSAAAASLSDDTPFVGVELERPVTPLVAGLYFPNIAAIHPNAPGASVFSVNAGSPTFLQVAEAGIYAVTAEFAMSGPATLPINGFIVVQVVSTGQFGTVVRNVLEHANTVATKRVQDLQGITFTHFAGADTLRYSLRTGQTMFDVGPLGYAVWRIARSYQP